MIRTLPNVERLSRDMQRLFDTPYRTAARWPAVNVWRSGDDVIVEAEIPGFKMDDVEVLAESSALTIRGHRQTDEQEGAVRIERTVTRFERTISMPMEIDADNAAASLKAGVLRVTLPLAASARPKRIAVSSADEC